MTQRKRGKRSRYYSVFLESALLACSARLSTSKAVRALGAEYSRNAKAQLLSPELESPNMATLQGLLLLSDYEMSQGRDRLGWMFCGKPLPVLLPRTLTQVQAWHVV